MTQTRISKAQCNEAAKTVNARFWGRNEWSADGKSWVEYRGVMYRFDTHGAAYDFLCEIAFQDLALESYFTEKYAGNTYCGNGEFNTFDECLAFANDGFCDKAQIRTQTGEIMRLIFKSK